MLGLNKGDIYSGALQGRIVDADYHGHRVTGEVTYSRVAYGGDIMVGLSLTRDFKTKIFEYSVGDELELNSDALIAEVD